MKKTLSLLLVLLLLLSLFACTKKGEPEPFDDPGVTPPPKITDPKTPPEAETPPVENHSFWDGGWYGYWGISSGEGLYTTEDYKGIWWDACVGINMEKGTLHLWDEACNADESIASFYVESIPEGAAAGGCLRLLDGFFIDEEIKADNRLLSPNGYKYENTVHFTGRYNDPGNPGSYFDYYVVLRPWGMLWEDVPVTERPLSYDSWYLPLAESGAPMPATIG